MFRETCSQFVTPNIVAWPALYCIHATVHTPHQWYVPCNETDRARAHHITSKTTIPGIIRNMRPSNVHEIGDAIEVRDCSEVAYCLAGHCKETQLHKIWMHFDLWASSSEMGHDSTYYGRMHTRPSMHSPSELVINWTVFRLRGPDPSPHIILTRTLYSV